MSSETHQNNNDTIDTINNSKKIGFWSFSVLLVVTIYVLNNGIQVFYQMGYASITYVILAIIIFFLPYTFMVTEMASAFHKHEGGIFSWMQASVGLRFSAGVTFLWYLSWIALLFTVGGIFCVTLSAAFTGGNASANWHIGSLSNAGTIAIISCIYLVLITFLTRKGIKQVSFFANISIIALIGIHILIIGGSAVFLFAHHGHFMQGFQFNKVSSYFYGPNKSYDNFGEALGFGVFAFFILGGMETGAGLIDKVKNPQKTAPKAMLMATFFIAGLYLVVITLTGLTINWNQTFGTVNSANLLSFQVFYTNSEFSNLALALGFTHIQAVHIGHIATMIVNWLTLITILNLPYQIYFPIKQTFEGLPKGMLPKFILKRNSHGMLENVLWIQLVFTVVIILLLGFGGSDTNKFFNITMDMLNLSATLPWALIIYAYIKFKLNDKIVKRYTFFNKKWGVIIGIISFIALNIVNLDFAITPFFEHQVSQGVWQLVGPIIFALLGIVVAQIYLIKRKSNPNL